MKAFVKSMYVVLIFLLTACATGGEDNQADLADPYITGQITEKTETSILVADEIYFSIDDETIIINVIDQAIDVSELSVGDTVAIWTNAPVMESFPAQGYAGKIKKQEAD